MKLIDLVADKLLETAIMEMAVKRKKAMLEITSKKYQIAMHLIKVLIFNDHAEDHWMKELDNWIAEINDIQLKPDNKRVEAKVYFEILFNEYYGHGTSILSAQVNRILKDPEYSKAQQTHIGIIELHTKLKEIYIKLCKDLGKGILLDIKDYINK